MKNFETTDLSLATFLKLSGIKLLHIRSISSYKFAFIFSDNELREQLTQDYFAHSTQVDALNLMNEFRNLKVMVKNQGR